MLSYAFNSPCTCHLCHLGTYCILWARGIRKKREQLNQNFCSYSQGYTWAKKRWRLGVAMHCQGCNTPAKGLKVKSMLVGRGPSTAPSLSCERAERAGRSLRGSRSVGCGATWRNTCLCDASMGQRKDMLDKTEPRCSARRR
jgi:hypothetical protein